MRLSVKPVRLSVSLSVFHVKHREPKCLGLAMCLVMCMCLGMCIHEPRHVSVSRETSRHVCHVQTFVKANYFCKFIFEFTFVNLILF